MKIKVLISENQPMLREGISVQLEAEKDIVLIRNPAMNESILESLNLHTPDILISDFNKDGYFDFEMLKKIVKKYGDRVRTIAFTENTKRSTLHNFLYFGGYGFLTKDCEKEEIVKAIRSVYQKDFYICSRLAGKLIHEFSITTPPPPDKTSLEKLSSRETEILRLFKKKKTTKEIASYLDISLSTVKLHVRHIKDKLGVHDLHELKMMLIYSDID
ncbi:MAG: response regulator transcription factor [Candidatus Latescibacterota bacterium]